ncbi:hypothetical protein [Haloarcula laminariae]|uniref:hypothetical protein n=1 Tax=Haloarcula laminariae TaxID=2961577 RepID=UPI00240554DF|nr:hypothetical protein [Halomicroarcula sp. FL173]
MFDTLILVAGPGISVAVLWSPILLSSRIRSLFDRLPPARSTIASYFVVAIELSIPFIIGTGVVFSTTSTEGAALSNALLNMVFVLTLVYVVVLPVTAVVGLPRISLDWDPTNYGFGTWLLLVGVVLWYAAVFVIPLVFFAFILALPTG